MQTASDHANAPWASGLAGILTWLVLLFPVVLLHACQSAPTPTESSPVPREFFRGLLVVPEDRCASYRPDDYSYGADVVGRIVLSMGGDVYSPYTGWYFPAPEDTEVEHVVALEEAHDSGMCSRPSVDKRAFASDLLNLTLVAPDVNREKGEKDAAEWLPEFNLCWFADRNVAIRQRYGLTVDKAEADVLGAILSSCESVDMVFLPPASAIRAINRMGGPVIFFYSRKCGTSDWGEDMLPPGPTGVIHSGESWDFTVKAGCYDLWASHLESLTPGPLLDKFAFDIVTSRTMAAVWSIQP